MDWKISTLWIVDLKPADVLILFAWQDFGYPWPMCIEIAGSVLRKSPIQTLRSDFCKIHAEPEKHLWYDLFVEVDLIFQ